MVNVSVIIPIYNVASYLPKCVDSVLSQTLHDIEIILVDDGSTDQSSQICDDYLTRDHRIQVIHKANGGLSSARNAGIDAAIGDFVAFVDADDYIMPEMLDTMYREAMNSCADVCVCKGILLEDGIKKPFSSDFIEPVIECGNIDFAKYYAKYLNQHQAPFIVCTSIFRRQMIKDNELFFIDTKIVFAEDTLFNLCVLSIANRIVRMNREFYIYCRRSGSLSTETTKIDFFNKYFQLVIHLKAYIKKHNDRLLSDRQMACLMWEFLRIACVRHKTDMKRLLESLSSMSKKNYIFKRYMLGMALGRSGSLYCRNYNLTGKYALHLRLTACYILLGKYEKAVRIYFV